MEHVEYIGEVQLDGMIPLPEHYRKMFLPGFKLRVQLQPLHNDGVYEKSAASPGHGLTSRQGIDLDYGGTAIETLLLVAAEDWNDWADPEEDIYDDFRERSAQR
jgi:hypothetical protein